MIYNYFKRDGNEKAIFEEMRVEEDIAGGNWLTPILEVWELADLIEKIKERDSTLES